MKKTIYYATGNVGKFEEIYTYVTRYFDNLEIAQFDKDLPEIQSMDQREIAIHKAKQAYELLGHPVLVDDSGIYFNKYKNFPGTLTKFIYHGIGFDGLLKLVQPGDSATFLLTLVYYYGPDKYECFEGRCNGFIKYDPRFQAPSTLPYDIIFSPGSTNKTYAELRNNIGEFEDYNYRIQAFKKFIDWYNNL